MRSYSHPHPNFTIRLVVCKIQRQLNEKHIVSQEKPEGSRGHHASLGRASEPTGAWGRRPAAPLPTPPPASQSLPYNRVPRLCLPSWGGGGCHLGARCGTPASEREGSQGRKRKSGLWNPTDEDDTGMWALPFAYEPCDLVPSRHHPHTLRFLEKYSIALMPALYMVSTPPEEAPWNVTKGENTGVPELTSRWDSRCSQRYPIGPARVVLGEGSL